MSENRDVAVNIERRLQIVQRHLSRSLRYQSERQQIVPTDDAVLQSHLIVIELPEHAADKRIRTSALEFGQCCGAEFSLADTPLARMPLVLQTLTFAHAHLPA